MLERVVPCQCKGPQPWRRSKKLLHSRRGLSQAFWRHGAGDLDLPNWCYAQVRALFEPERGRFPKGTKSGATGTFVEDGPLLDFLYPPKTRAVINQLSSWTSHHWARQGSGHDTVGAVRPFTQIATKGRTPNSRPTPTDLWTIDLAEKGSKNSYQSISPNKALEILYQHTEAFKQGRYTALRSETWQLFLLIAQKAKTPDLLHQLIDIFAQSSRAVDGRRLTRLFDALPIASYTADSAFKSIVSLLEEGSIGKATRIYDTVLENVLVPDDYPATDLLLMHTIGDHQWQLAFHVWKSRLKFSENKSTSGKYETWSTAFFAKAANMPGFESHVLALLNWLKRTPMVLFNAGTGITKFLLGLSSNLCSEKSPATSDTKLKVLLTMRGLDLSRPGSYELACVSALKTGSASMQEKKQRAMKIYEAFRADRCFLPRKSLLKELLSTAVEVNDETAVSLLLADWRQFHQSDSSFVAGLVMKFYANRGNPEVVEALLKEYLASGQTKDVRMMHPLLHAYAVLADPISVEEKLAGIQATFGNRPDIVCLNILLNAHAKAESLDGALNALTLFTKTGYKPDDYTLGTIMSIAADRGDVDTINQLLNVATSLKIPRTTVMMDTLVLAHLNNEDAKTAEAVAEKRTTTIAQRNGRLSESTRMWTQILAYYAVRKNFEETIRISKRMQELRVPFSGMTYSAIMRVFAGTKRTNMARSILDRIVTKGANRAQAIHYAIVIDGFAGEYRFEDAFRVHADMITNGVTPTLSTQLALLRVHALAAQHKLTYDTARHPGVRLDISEEALEEFITGFDPSLLTNKDPQLRSSIISSRIAPHAAYFEFLLASYGSRRAYDVVKTLLAKSESFASRVRIGLQIETSLPMRLLETVMKVNYRQSAFDDVERYWALAKSTAKRLANTAGKTNTIPPARRHLLARIVDVYMRALTAQNKIEEMRKVIDDLLAVGFSLDNSNWNLYIQLLATAGRYSEAWLTCERNIMASFPGWFPREPKARKWAKTQAKEPGLEYLGDRLTFLAPGQLQATYQTMIRLAKTLETLRNKAPFDHGCARELEKIRKKAPRTYGAVRALPTINHPSATHVLGLKSVDGEKRRLPEV